MVSGYYDDFTQIETARLAESAEPSLKRMFEILGFDLAMDARKDKRFSSKFSPLGIEVDFEESQHCIVKLAPKPSRVSKVVELCAEALASDSLPVLSARSLCGVLWFLREGHFGRTGATVLKALTDHVQLGCEKVAAA